MRGKKVWIIIGAVVLLLLAGGGTYFFLASRNTGTATAAKKPTKHLFADLQNLLVNIHGQSQDGLVADPGMYLQLGFKLETTSAKTITDFKALLPAIRGNVLNLLLDASSDVVSHSSARNKMKQKVLGVVNQTLNQNDPALGKHPFTQIYLTNFVTQAE